MRPPLAQCASSELPIATVQPQITLIWAIEIDRASHSAQTLTNADAILNLVVSGVESL